MRTHFKLACLFALAIACSGDDTTTEEGGVDATADNTVQDAAKDAFVADAPNDSSTDALNDAPVDVAVDAPNEASLDAGILDAAIDAPIVDAAFDGPLYPCDDGGCKTYASYCKATPCECFALGSNDPNPSCDSGVVQCFVAPCANKTAACVNNVCVIQ